MKALKTVLLAPIVVLGFIWAWVSAAWRLGEEIARLKGSGGES